MGCKAIVFPKQFKSQHYYNILKQICPEVEKAQPGALKSQRWGSSRVGRGTSLLYPGPLSPYPSLWALPQPLTLITPPTTRLPDLTTVISVDAHLPGTLLLDKVVAAGSQEQNLARLRHTQQFLSCHDPINIQFTSVGQRSPGPDRRLAC